MQLKMALVTWCVLLMYISATRGQQEDTRPLTCYEQVKQEMEEDGVMIADKEYPRCDHVGDYRVKQCYGQWTGRGHCGCVNPMSGVTFTDVIGVMGRSQQAELMTCRCALDYKRAADRASYCDLNTGDYKPVVCIEEKCRCAERWGAPMNRFDVFNKGDSNCLCAQALADVSGFVGTSYNCDSYGNFRPLQCKGSACFCVNDGGIQEGKSVQISKADKLKCLKYSNNELLNVLRKMIN